MDLIERLERATEGSRELDAAIWSDIAPLEVAGKCGFKGMKYAGHIHTKAEKVAHIQRMAEHYAPAYSTSLDAALSLAGERAYSVLLEAMAIAAGFFCTFQDKGDHIKRMLPLFVCRAALRARQSQEAR